MKILVTGATGFIGSNLVERLKKNYQVRILVRSKSLKFARKLGVEMVVGDITDQASLVRAVKGVDVIINCAAVLPHRRLESKVYWLVNCQGVENLLQVARRQKIKRFVQVSTVGIFGNDQTKIINEKSPLKLSDPYSESKAEAEKVVLRYFHEFKIPVTIVRPTIAFGPGDTRPGFSNLFALIQKRLFLPVGDGSNYFHTIYIDNLIDGLCLAMLKSSAIGQDFIIGDDPCPTMNQIISSIAKVEKVRLPAIYLPTRLAKMIGLVSDLIERLGVRSPLNSRRVQFITQNRRYSIKKAKQLLGYNPKVGLDEAMAKTFNWYKINGL